jgi:hypothetical protein
VLDLATGKIGLSRSRSASPRHCGWPDIDEPGDFLGVIGWNCENAKR